MVTLNSQRYAVGIDVGGSSLKCGLIADDGFIHYSNIVSLEAAKTEDAIIYKMAKAIKDCASMVPEILGVGIGFPGVIENNIVIGGADNMPGFENFQLGAILSEQTGIHNIKIENDANLMGLGEQKFGAAKYCTDVIFLTVGTGIGGAVMIGNKLFAGFRNRGAELGHLVVKHGGADCSCGGQGCLEAYASVSALVSYYRQISNSRGHLDGRYIIARYLSGEEYAVEAMTRHFDYLASGIVGLVNVFSPQKIVIGGGISEAGPFYIEEIQQRVMAKTLAVTSSHTEFVAATLGNKAGVLGAAAHVFQDINF